MANTTALICQIFQLPTGVFMENTKQTLCFYCHNNISPGTGSASIEYLVKPRFYGSQPDYKEYEKHFSSSLPLVTKPTITSYKENHTDNSIDIKHKYYNKDGYPPSCFDC